MMGSSHALTGAATWLAVSATGLTGQSGVQVTAGTLLCAGAALLPDLDLTGKVIRGRGGAVAARAFGRGGLVVAEAVGWLAGRVYQATATPADLARRSAGNDPAHRTLTHTWPWQLAVGGLAGLAATTRPGLGALTAVLTLMALRAVPGVSRACRGPVGIVVALAAGGVTAVTAGPSVLLAAATVALGGLVHMAGDSVTVWGVPWMWPFKVHGRRWWCSGLPRALRIHTGATSRPEAVIRWATCAVGVACTAQLAGIIPVLTQ